MNKTCRLSAYPQTNALLVWGSVYCVENYIVMYECDMKASVVGVHNSEIIHVSKPQSNDTYYHTHTSIHAHAEVFVACQDITECFSFKRSGYLKQIFSETKQTNKTMQSKSLCVFHHLVLQHVHFQQGVRRLYN